VRNSLAVALCVLALAGCDAGDDGGDPAASGDRPSSAGAARQSGGASTSGGAVRPTGDGRVEPGEIRVAGLREHLRALQEIAEVNGGNRAAGTPGDDASVEYVVDRLREAGWRVELDPVPFPYFDERSPPRLDDLREGDQFRTLSYSGSGRVEGRTRRLGLGCTPGEFAPLQRGEVAIVTRGACFFRDKARHAESAGAAALLIVDEESDEPPSATLGAPGTGLPVLAVGAAAGRELGPRVELEVDAVSERRRTVNVIAETATDEGDRVVMAGGHLDSVPAGPGINDNGSGTAALLELADALGGRALGARVRLAFWGAEELGLIGSRRYVRDLAPGERERIAAYVNLDMVGSPEPAQGVYSDADPGLERLLRRLIGRGAEEENAGANSDHAPFQRAGVPVGGLFTGAGEPHDLCYHRACDDIDNVDMPILVRMARAAGEAVERLSERG
jgi:Zn-dependent M28 family amino/carboxypeptidase